MQRGLMLFDVADYLLIDIDNEFSKALIEHYLHNAEQAAPSGLIVAGANTRQLVKMMFNEQIKDYCYCDIENEISVTELASYLHEHHAIKGVLINHTDYLLADDRQRFIFNSMHETRLLVSHTEQGYTFTPVAEKGYVNHLSCHTDSTRTAIDLSELALHLNKKN
jgi:hypothetical protein